MSVYFEVSLEQAQRRWAAAMERASAECRVALPDTAQLWADAVRRISGQAGFIPDHDAIVEIAIEASYRAAVVALRQIGAMAHAYPAAYAVLPLR